ncbi:MAG TPA: choice-of-anchor D domain-containing protein [Pseudobdellovibrionaceae bacterium]|nr:choice-of-anchor D domain-containing protein [Pseudobdellovibrionaceae bacterium]
MNFSKTDRQQALSAMSASTIWGQSTPVSLAGMKCFAVLISAADGLNDVSCTRLDGSEVFKSKHMAGLAPAGGVLSLEVPSGKAREIIVVGFGATDLGACMTVEDELPNLSLSAPMILARKTVDLPAGSVDVDLAATYNASQVFETCSSLELPTATPTPVPTASMSLSTGANYTFADTSVGAVSTHLVTVTNSGIAPATGINVLGLAAPFGFAGGSYPGSSGTCGTTLAAGSSCSLQIAFSPSTSGTQNDTLDFNYHDGVQTQTVALALEATALDVAVLSLNGGSGYNFGNITIGANASYTFTVVNSGGSTATLTPPTVTGMFTYTGGAYPGTAGTCAGTLSAGASCSIQVNFAPISGGGQSFTYTMNYDDGAGAQSASVTLSGTGVSPAVLTLSDGPTYVFSATAVGASLDHTFTLSNSGGSTATTITGSGLAAPFTFKGGSFPGTGGTCAATLAAAANCTIVVNFAPSITGLATDTLVVNFNDGATPQMVSGDVQGDGLSVASLSFDLSPTVNFPNATAGASSSMTVVVTNTGQSMASSIAASGVTLPFEFSGGVYPGVGGTCATTLAGGANCTMVLVFGPVSATTSNATLSLGYNNGAAAVNSTLGLTGTGLSPAVISISNGPTFNFGSVAQGGYFDWPLTLTNTGNSTATITADSGGLASPFTYAGGGGYPGVGGTCTSTLAPAANCTVVLRFAPSVSGSYTDTLEISYNNGAIGSSATRDLSGTGVIQASLSISDGPTYNFGSRNVNTSVNHTFTINNTGGYSASSMTGSIGGDFTFVGGSYPGTGGTCGATLGMGSSCTIVVRFLPMTVTSHSETITINYHNGASNQAATRPVQGLGTNPSFDQTNSFVTVSNSTLASGSSATVSFFARDNQGDPYVVPGTVVFSNFGGTSTVNIGPVTDQGGGEYTATISGQVAGTITTLSATFNSMSISSSLPTLTVIPGPVSEVTSTVSVSSSVINVSELVTVMLQARDAQGNLRTSGGDVVVFGTTGGTSTVSFGSVTDNGDGTYTASMTGSSAGTATTLTATINGLSVTTTMPTVTVNP